MLLGILRSTQHDGVFTCMQQVMIGTVLDKAASGSACRLTGLALHSQRKKLRGEIRVTL